MNIFRKKEKNQAVRNGEMQAQQVKGIARTCQDVMDFEGFLADETGDGIMVVKNGKIYSKMYRLVDSNFVTEPEDRQLEILEKFEKLLNRFAETIDISFVIVNKRNTVAEMR